MSRFGAGEVLAFSPAHDSHGKKDDTHAFHPRAERFVEIHGGTHLDLPNDRPMLERAAFVLDTIRASSANDPKIIAVAFFCHGWSRGIQAGFDLRPNRGMHPRALAAALRDRAGVGLLAPLFCCSTADSPDNDAPGGDGGFADALRDELSGAGLTNCRVDAHATRGHTTRNPNVRRFEGDGSPRHQAGGYDLIPKTSRLRRRWRRWLRRDDNDLLFPFLDSAAIYRRLDGLRVPE